MADKNTSFFSKMQPTNPEWCHRFINCLIGYSRLLDECEGQIETLAQGLADSVFKMLSAEGTCHVQLDYPAGKASAGDSAASGLQWETSRSTAAQTGTALKVTCRVPPEPATDLTFYNNVQLVLETLLRHFSRSVEQLKRTENALDEKNKCQELLGHLPWMAFLKDCSGKYLACNEPFAKSCKKRPEELIGKTDFELFPENRAREYRTQDREVLESGKPGTWEIQRSRPDGIHWLQIVKTPVFDENGKAIRLIGTVQDITATRQAEQAMAAANQRYEAIFSRSSFGIFIHDLAGRFIDANPATLDMCGYSAAEIGSITLENLLQGKDLKRVKQNMEQLIRSGHLVEIPTYRMLRKDGGYRWVRADATPLYDREGRPEAILGIVKDVTQRVESEQRVRNILNATTDGIIGLDREGNTMFVNRAATDMLGHSEAEMVGRSSVSVWHHGRKPGEHHPANCPICQALTDGVAVHRDHDHFHRKDGTPFPVSYECTPLTTEDSHRALVLTFRDLTEHEQMEAQFRQSQKMEAVGRLAGGVAHDFNNILTAIGGFTQLSLIKADKDSPIRGYLEQVEKAADRGADLTRQLLAFSRKEEVKPEVLDWNSVIKNMHTMLVRLIGEDIRLSTALDATIGTIEADPGQLEQLLMNMVVNARDAIIERKQTGKQAEIFLETTSVFLDSDYCMLHPGAVPGPYIMLAIRDTGCGMDEETQSKIFEPFFTTKESGKGTGLGLATCFGIVKQNRGSIYVYSEPGKGTTFKVYWPLYEGDKTVKKVVVQQKISGFFGTARVLVVEDDASVRSFVSAGLAMMGFDTMEAASGEEALKILEQEEPVQIVFSDVVMPGMDGVHLVEQIREKWPGTRAVLTSGYTRGQYSRITDIEGVRFVRKPYDLREISSIIQKLLK